MKLAQFENQIEVSNAIKQATDVEVYFDDTSLVDAKSGKTILHNALNGCYSVAQLIVATSDFEFKSNGKYGIDDLFYSVNEIYSDWDEGKLEYSDAREMLVRCCEAYITKDPQR